VSSPRVPLPNTWRSADFVIAHPQLPNLQNRTAALVPPLLNRQQSTLNIVCNADLVPTQILPLPKDIGNWQDSQLMVSADYNIPQLHRATVEAAK